MSTDPESPRDGENPQHPAVEGPESGLEEERHPERDVEAEAERLGGELESARQEAAENLDKARRALADFENFRRRARQDAQAAADRAREQVLAEILPVLDNFDRALAHAGDGGALLDGVRLIQRQLQAALEKQGLEALDAEGKQFDPLVHEAIAREPTAEHAEGTVLEVYERGYRLGGKVLRPARVKVAAPPAPDA